MPSNYLSIYTGDIPGFPLTGAEIKHLLLFITQWVETFDEGDKTEEWEKYHEDHEKMTKIFDKLDDWVKNRGKTTKKE